MAKRLVLLGTLLVGVTGWLIVATSDVEADAAGDVAVGADTVVVLSGRFSPSTSASSAVVFREGSRLVLRLAATRADEALQVYLVGGPRARNRAELERVGFVDLGTLRAGAPTYAIPAATPLSRIQSVVLWDGTRAVAVAELRRP